MGRVLKCNLMRCTKDCSYDRFSLFVQKILTCLGKFHDLIQVLAKGWTKPPFSGQKGQKT